MPGSRIHSLPGPPEHAPGLNQGLDPGAARGRRAQIGGSVVASAHARIAPGMNRNPFMSTTIATGGTEGYDTDRGGGRDATLSARQGVHRRWTTEQLAEHAARLARQNEALQDFAALVAHDVKSSLLSALMSDEPRESLIRALELVDSILEATRADRADAGPAQGADCVLQAIADLGGIRAEVITTVTGEFPIPPAALRLVLRNLLANAVAARAERIHVSTVAGGDRRVLVVDDDGVGLAATDHYATASQLGFALCRRLVARFGGGLALTPRAGGGTRAVLVLGGADR